MPLSEHGSLTKEPPLARMDETIQAIQPGMTYNELLEYAREHTHGDAPGLVRKRFLLVQRDGTIVFDRFLSLLNTEPIASIYVRKVMFFVWAFRDDRLRRFICECVARKDGKWRITELQKKSNAEFFKEWLEESTARKARSNIQYFLTEETGIVDIDSRTVHLELVDRWLFEAAAIAAEHEPDPVERRYLLKDPVQYLIDYEWTALANATADELLELGNPSIEATLPLEDEDIGVRPHAAEGKEWNRKKPKRTDKQTTQAYINLVARERANQSHHLLERITADAARDLDYEPRYNDNIDLYFETPHGMVLAEMKSCDSKSVHSQVRKGVSQLYEYRYIYHDILGDDPALALIVETKPPRDKAWLIDYLASLGIVLAWKKPWEEVLVSSAQIPDALNGIIRPEPA